MTPPRRAASSLLIRIDPASPLDLQQQVYLGLQRAIRDGVLSPGAPVPSSRQLAVDLGVSRTTTLLALDQLQAEGYLVTRRGAGTFVATDLPDAGVVVRRPWSTGIREHPALSRRGALLAGSPPAARRLSGPPRPFRIGVPALDLFPSRTWSQLAARRLRTVGTTQLDYGEPAGLRALREAIADHVTSSRGTRCSADQVFVTAGAQRALFFAANVLLDPGDEAWMEEPGYPGAWAALRAAGARLVPVPVDEEGLDVDEGVRRAPRARMAYVSPSHQYPAGVPLAFARRQALLAWARQAQAWVLEDDYDAEFRWGARPIPCLQGLDRDDRVIYVGTFAKTLFPSLRIGFLVAPLDLRDQLVAARRATDPPPPSLDQAVLADFMSAGHFARHLRRMRAACRERREALAEAAARHCGGGLRLRPALTGLHVVADIVDGPKATRVFKEAADRGVEVMPLAAFHLGEPTRDDALVLGFGAVRPERLDAGMEQLAAAIDGARR